MELFQRVVEEQDDNKMCRSYSVNKDMRVNDETNKRKIYFVTACNVLGDKLRDLFRYHWQFLVRNCELSRILNKVPSASYKHG